MARKVQTQSLHCSCCGAVLGGSTALAKPPSDDLELGYGGKNVQNETRRSCQCPEQSLSCQCKGCILLTLV